MGRNLGSKGTENIIKGDSKGKSKGKGKGKPAKKKPEDFGFSLSDEGLYVRSPQLACGLPVQTANGAASGMEVGTLDKLMKAGALPSGSAELEILCNRQTLFGNPFSMLRGKPPGESASGPGVLSEASGRGPRERVPEDPEMRDRVCELFEHFLDAALSMQNTGSLLDIAEKSTKSLLQPASIIGKDWAKEYGSRSCKEFRDSFDALSHVKRQRNGRIRLLCHCVPLRCHVQSIASRLCCDATVSSDDPDFPESAGVAPSGKDDIHDQSSADKSCCPKPPVEVHTQASRTKRWGKSNPHK